MLYNDREKVSEKEYLNSLSIIYNTIDNSTIQEAKIISADCSIW